MGFKRPEVQIFSLRPIRAIDSVGRVPPSHGGSQGFESLIAHQKPNNTDRRRRLKFVLSVFKKAIKPTKFGIIAQLVEHMPYKHGVIGSSPIGSTKNKVDIGRPYFYVFCE